ncbi:Phosphatase 2C family protein [Hibiscus syriacus]|uniref:Phosphatase 2C family protein n=1 Tax=Hibiscus syriacus TaxID=106335 RepID=A0A6A3CPT0_HIBSY|nr:uncharacterized protein LOC120154127 [Hibiscus syriacus]KAE8731163.1 Phosphatase 2C family protein [Hibiscus syriacus]
METATANDNGDPSDVQVQHVTKKSSDELLRKFAELEEDGDGDKGAALRRELRLMAAKRRKRSGSARSRRESSDSPSNNGLVERKWLLPPAAATRRSTLLKQLRSQLRGREIGNRSIFGTIEKTWRKTIEGASRVFMDKHYNRHRRLINDVV